MRSIACQTNYHHDFYVKNGMRIYYDDIPDVLQVEEHQFVERQVVQHWINLMLISWLVVFVISDALLVMDHRVT